MQKNMLAYPEVVFWDNTRKLLQTNMSVSLLLVENASGLSEIVVVGLLVSENEESTRAFLEAFAKNQTEADVAE